MAEKGDKAMMPEVAIQSPDTNEAEKDSFAKDWPDLQNKSDAALFSENSGLFEALDEQFRFKLLDGRDLDGFPRILDTKTGKVLEHDDADVAEFSLIKFVIHQQAYHVACDHLKAEFELKRNLRAERDQKERDAFKRLMVRAGYDYEDGVSKPLEWKVEELLGRKHPLDSLFGKGWLKK
jgi:hypothetical protein